MASESQSSAVSLEAFSLGFASICCFFYGILGVATICSTECNTAIDGDSYTDQKIKLTPILASFYCSAILITGYALWKFRYTTVGVAEYLENTSDHSSLISVQGHKHLTMSLRLALGLAVVFVVVIVLARSILLQPLETGCKSLEQSKNPFMFSIRVTLKRMEPWVVGSGVAFLLISLAFNWREKNAIEKQAHESKYGKQESHREEQRRQQVIHSGIELKAGGAVQYSTNQPSTHSTPPSYTQYQDRSDEHIDRSNHSNPPNIHMPDAAYANAAHVNAAHVDAAHTNAAHTNAAHTNAANAAAAHAAAAHAAAAHANAAHSETSYSQAPSGAPPEPDHSSSSDSHIPTNNGKNPIVSRRGKLHRK